jgi:uncharacterized protein DUF4410
MKTCLRLVLALAVLAAPASEAFAKKKPAPTAPGKYTEWDGEVDTLEIVEPFKLADYSRIVVESFDTSATPLPEEKDNTYAPVKNVLARTAPPFVEGLSGNLPKPPAVAGEVEKKPEPGSLLVRGKVILMDPGSQAARYWAGFGAGAARTGIDGEVVDAGTGKVLLRFRQERRSGVGMFGGDYEKLMDRNLRTIGADLAGVLKHF